MLLSGHSNHPSRDPSTPLPPPLERRLGGSRFRTEKEKRIHKACHAKIDIQLVGVILTFGTELTETRT